MPWGWADVTFELTSVCLWCVGLTYSHISVSHFMFCSNSPQRRHSILMMSLSVTLWSYFHLQRSTKAQMHVDINTHTPTHTPFDSWHLKPAQVMHFISSRTRCDQVFSSGFLTFFCSTQCWDIFFFIIFTDILQGNLWTFEQWPSETPEFEYQQFARREADTVTHLCSPGCQHNAPHSLPALPFDTALAPVRTWKNIKNQI